MAKLPRWIWAVGLVLIVLNGLLFILQCVEAAPTHSGMEKAVLVIGLTVGVALVAWYWVAGWVRLLQDAKPGSSLLSRISLHHRILIGIALLVFVALGLQWFRMSFNPALTQSEDFVRTNEAVLASYGPINDLSIDALFWNVETAPDGTSTGKYTFHLFGSKRAGAVQVHWREEHGTYMTTEIDDLPGDDLAHPQPLWKSK